MRPNVDIPWGVHGRVVQIAEERDLSRDEAYELVLRAGLGELEDDPG